MLVYQRVKHQTFIGHSYHNYVKLLESSLGFPLRQGLWELFLQLSEVWQCLQLALGTLVSDEDRPARKNTETTETWHLVHKYLNMYTIIFVCSPYMLWVYTFNIYLICMCIYIYVCIHVKTRYVKHVYIIYICKHVSKYLCIYLCCMYTM